MRLTAQDLIQNAIDADPGLVESAGFVRYDPATGEIVEVGVMARSLIEQEKADGKPILQSVMLTMDEMLPFLAQNYVQLETGTILPKQPFPGSFSGQTLSGLPVPCRIKVSIPFQTGQGFWEPQVHEVEDTEIELSFDVPDKYEIAVESTVYETARFVVDTNG